MVPREEYSNVPPNPRLMMQAPIFCICWFPGCALSPTSQDQWPACQDDLGGSLGA